MFVFNVIKFLYKSFFLPLFYYCTVYIVYAANCDEIKVFKMSIIVFIAEENNMLLAVGPTLP